MTRIAAFVALLLATPAGQAAITPTGCDPAFRAQPLTYVFDYANDIQAVYSQFCEDCHVNFVGGFCNGPCGGLDLNIGQSYFGLVHAPSNQDVTILLVSPGKPDESLLFRKLNCSNPGPLAGLAQMPLNRPPLSAALQARIYDWIALGAPEPDTLLKATFETWR